MSMAMGNWEMQAGDPAIFSFALGFAANPHGDDDRAAREERLSWGYFSVWANGENLCSHLEQGETMDAVHWYVLPLMEWIVADWDPLLHEEKLPLRNAGTSAAESMARTIVPPPSVKELDELEWLDEWSAWWHRHNVRASSPGGLLPDLYIRRYRDQLEISTGAEPLADSPSDVFFVTPRRVHHVEPTSASSAVFRVLSAAADELHNRIPGADRVSTLLTQLHGLTAPDRREKRLAWVAGIDGDYELYSQIAAEVDGAFADLSADLQEGIKDLGPSSDLVTYGSPYARLLFGCASPSTSLEDTRRLAAMLAENYVKDVRAYLHRLQSEELDTVELRLRQLAPWEQGSRLGEVACQIFGEGNGQSVDIHRTFQQLRVAVSKIDFSDVNIRAVSVFGPTQKPHVFCNRLTRWGLSAEVERFTLAHELCHLLLDREWGNALAVASGPWAPLAIEQRANAFAAAFLMPSWLLSDALATLDRPADDPESITELSTRLRVSRSSLIDRLYNLGELAPENRVRLREHGLDETAEAT